MPKHDEDDLRKLYDFIDGRGEWAHYGGGIWTHPEGDRAERFKHDACVELERRGLIRRKAEESGLCIWETVETRPEGKS